MISRPDSKRRLPYRQAGAAGMHADEPCTCRMPIVKSGAVRCWAKVHKAKKIKK